MISLTISVSRNCTITLDQIKCRTVKTLERQLFAINIKLAHFLNQVGITEQNGIEQNVNALNIWKTSVRTLHILELEQTYLNTRDV